MMRNFEQPFMWGAGGQIRSPEQLQQERELMEAALGRAGDMSPVGHWTQGAARVLDTVGGVMRQRRVNDADARIAQFQNDNRDMDEPMNRRASVIAALLAQGGR